MGNACCRGGSISGREGTTQKDFKIAGATQQKIQKNKNAKAGNEKSTKKIEGSMSVKYNPSQIFSNLRTGTFEENYALGKQLGQGGFGTVYECTKKDDQRKRAVKIIKKSGQSKVDRDLFLKETDILRQISHPNIIQIYEMFEDETFYYLVTELVSGGDLFDVIERSNGQFTEKQVANYIQEILLAINHCHSMNICHRDLKPENILIDSENRVKIIDFGTAKKIKNTDGIHGMKGTPYYMAPEVVQNQNYNEKCDVWSIGVIMYVLLTGIPPFNGRDDEEIFQKIRMGNLDLKPLLKRKISSSGTELIKRMLATDQTRRISSQEAVEHKWFQQFQSADDNKLDSKASADVLKSLNKFSESQKMRRIVLSFIANQLTSREEHRDAEIMFKNLDKNKDGVLTRDELINGYRSIYGSMTETEVDKILKAADLDGNGTIDFDEWRAATIKFNSHLSQTRLKQAFDFFDKDHSGSISVDELKEALCAGASKEDPFNNKQAFDKLIKDVDRDGNGEIDFEEFKQMMTVITEKTVDKKKGKGKE